MTPIFTVHAGEYLVGTHLERTFRGCRVWIPSKDSGIDLLLTNASCSRTVPLQVKYSRDYVDSSVADPTFRTITRSSFVSLQRQKIETSPARYWVIVLHSFTSKSPCFLVITPTELLKRIETHHGRQKTYRLYFCAVGESNCWELRCPVAEKRKALALGTITPSRDFSEFLDNWSKIRHEVAV
jgi:hypothetical protein